MVLTCLHVVCAWIGNSQTIAARHYLQVTDADFDQAAQPAARRTKRAHSTAQNRLATTGNCLAIAPGPTPTLQPVRMKKPPVFAGTSASDCGIVPNAEIVASSFTPDEGMGGKGLEPLTPSV